MTVIVCPMETASAQCVSRAAQRAVSLLSPNLAPPVLDLPAERRLHLAFNDIAEPSEGLVHPTEAHIAALRRLGPSAVHRRSFGPVQSCHPR